jgi:hypothetical protein
MATDHRQNARARTEALLGLLRNDSHQSELENLIAECEALARAISAFHMEGIRFRMFNVDRLLAKGSLPVPAEVTPIFADVRRELEAAGFHTRSHQAPPTT